MRIIIIIVKLKHGLNNVSNKRKLAVMRHFDGLEPN